MYFCCCCCRCWPLCNAALLSNATTESVQARIQSRARIHTSMQHCPRDRVGSMTWRLAKVQAIYLDNLTCWLTSTQVERRITQRVSSETTHKTEEPCASILRGGLDDAPLVSGHVVLVSPRNDSEQSGAAAVSSKVWTIRRSPASRRRRSRTRYIRRPRAPPNNYRRPRAHARSHISRSRFISLCASTTHASRRTAREQTSQLSASSLLKMTLLPTRIQPFQQHPRWALAPSKRVNRGAETSHGVVNTVFEAVGRH